MENIDIQYTYHVHQGETSVNGGCYTVPIQHSHNNSCYRTCTSLKWDKGTENGYSLWACDGCGWSKKYSPGTEPPSEQNGSVCGRQILNCNISTSITGYSLGCGKTTDTIESATINFN